MTDSEPVPGSGIRDRADYGRTVAALAVHQLGDGRGAGVLAVRGGLGDIGLHGPRRPAQTGARHGVEADLRTMTTGCLTARRGAPRSTAVCCSRGGVIFANRRNRADFVPVVVGQPDDASRAKELAGGRGSRQGRHASDRTDRDHAGRRGAGDRRWDSRYTRRGDPGHASCAPCRHLHREYRRATRERERQLRTWRWFTQRSAPRSVVRRMRA